jgi:hypothetical protein
MLVRYALKIDVQVCQKHFISKAAPHHAWYLGDRRQNQKLEFFGMGFMALIL